MYPDQSYRPFPPRPPRASGSGSLASLGRHRKKTAPPAPPSSYSSEAPEIPDDGGWGAPAAPAPLDKHKSAASRPRQRTSRDEGTADPRHPPRKSWDEVTSDSHHGGTTYQVTESEGDNSRRHHRSHRKGAAQPSRQYDDEIPPPFPSRCHTENDLPTTPHQFGPVGPSTPSSPPPHGSSNHPRNIDGAPGAAQPTAEASAVPTWYRSNWRPWPRGYDGHANSVQVPEEKKKRWGKRSPAPGVLSADQPSNTSQRGDGALSPTPSLPPNIDGDAKEDDGGWISPVARVSDWVAGVSQDPPPEKATTPIREPERQEVTGAEGGSEDDLPPRPDSARRANPPTTVFYSDDNDSATAPIVPTESTPSEKSSEDNAVHSGIVVPAANTAVRVEPPPPHSVSVASTHRGHMRRDGAPPQENKLFQKWTHPTKWWRQSLHPSQDPRFVSRRLCVKVPWPMKVVSLKQLMHDHFGRYGRIRVLQPLLEETETTEIAEIIFIFFHEEESVHKVLEDPESIHCTYRSATSRTALVPFDLDIRQVPATGLTSYIWIKLTGPRPDAFPESSSPTPHVEPVDTNPLPEFITAWAVPSVKQRGQRLWYQVVLSGPGHDMQAQFASAERHTGQTAKAITTIHLASNIPEEEILKSLVECFVDVVRIRRPSEATNNGWIFESAGGYYIDDLLRMAGSIPGVTVRYATSEETPVLTGERSAAQAPMQAEPVPPLKAEVPISAITPPPVVQPVPAPVPPPTPLPPPKATSCPPTPPAEPLQDQGDPKLPFGQGPWVGAFGGALPVITPIMVPRLSLQGEGQGLQPMMFMGVMYPMGPGAYSEVVAPVQSPVASAEPASQCIPASGPHVSENQTDGTSARRREARTTPVASTGTLRATGGKYQEDGLWLPQYNPDELQAYREARGMPPPVVAQGQLPVLPPPIGGRPISSSHQNSSLTAFDPTPGSQFTKASTGWTLGPHQNSSLTAFDPTPGSQFTKASTGWTLGQYPYGPIGLNSAQRNQPATPAKGYNVVPIPVPSFEQKPDRRGDPAPATQHEAETPNLNCNPRDPERWFESQSESHTYNKHRSNHTERRTKTSHGPKPERRFKAGRHELPIKPEPAMSDDVSLTGGW